MSAHDKDDAEASTSNAQTSNKKKKVNNTGEGINLRSWVWLYFDHVYVDNVRHAICKNAGKTSKYLRHIIADVSTRWNSSYLAWCHLLELEKYIRILEVELAEDMSHDFKKDSQYLTKIMLTNNEWALLRDLIPILGLFEEATRYLGGSNYVTYSTMNPILIHIINKLKPISVLSEEINIKSIKDIFLELEICDDENNSQNLDKPMQTSGVLEKVKETLYRAMQFYWKKDDNELYLPSILDPRVKKFDFASNKIRQVQDFLKTKYHNAKDGSLPITISATSSTSSYVYNTQSVSSLYTPTLLDFFNNQPSINSDTELDEYLFCKPSVFEYADCRSIRMDTDMILCNPYYLDSNGSHH
ncbi:14793_t:CDS:2 [Cetraspora pellucida]|uniref:14793_t:CDS:1 n=1 Tax=Cetraspora pellucida TaxID=1433469 RepID=A0ACA9KPD6_9GLOM|nr:14793_t:CDS:2 [Cetraspora pellucida]